MNIALWIVASVLAAAFLASGAAKIFQPREKLIAGGYGWAEDVSPLQVKLIGVVEAVGAVGLIVPAALGILEVLTPAAGVGLALVMVVAVLVHIRRHETKHVVSPLVLGAIAAAVAVLRFGPFSF
ncbi:MAG: DoxX family protein [Pseudonocardiaceae bacterium]|nr:DoxX family protein [Pseudonocardiaceae bacterium]